ncbi:D-aminoacyl-tRNA deacylase [Breznakiellaceae bacterium SP9]
MKAVIQRVSSASVSVDGVVCGSIDKGILAFIGVAAGDTEEDALYLADKITALRIFPDEAGRMNRSVKDAGGSVLAISQFTLLADTRKGRRPYYGGAAEPVPAKRLYEYFMEQVRAAGLCCEAGIFAAQMRVQSTNEGPVTIILDSQRK